MKSKILRSLFVTLFFAVVYGCGGNNSSDAGGSNVEGDSSAPAFAAEWKDAAGNEIRFFVSDGSSESVLPTVQVSEKADIPHGMDTSKMLGGGMFQVLVTNGQADIAPIEIRSKTSVQEVVVCSQSRQRCRLVPFGERDEGVIYVMPETDNGELLIGILTAGGGQ